MLHIFKSTRVMQKKKKNREVVKHQKAKAAIPEWMVCCTVERALRVWAVIKTSSMIILAPPLEPQEPKKQTTGEEEEEGKLKGVLNAEKEARRRRRRKTGN